MKSLLTSHFNSKLIKVSRSVHNFSLHLVDRIICPILYGPYHMDHLMWRKSYYIDYIICTILYGSYRMDLTVYCTSRRQSPQLSFEHNKKTDVRATDTEITVVFHDLDGSEAYAKRAASQISKKLKSFPGLTSVDVEYSGSPPGMSGGAVFGIIFLVATIVAISGFAYIKDWFEKFCIQKMIFK